MSLLDIEPMANVPVKTDVTRLGAGTTSQGNTYPGGLDLLTPSLNLQPGALVDGINFEVLQNGGYGRIVGYERFDGQPSPSAATSQTLQVVAFTNVPAVGAAIAQASSGATAVVAAVDTDDLYMVITKIVGDFDDTGAVTSGATPIGTAVEFTAEVTDQQAAQYLNAAADIYRADILVVPGSGNVLGFVVLNEVGYAFRANSGGTAVDIYKTSAGGWVNVPFFKLVNFSAGAVTTPLDGETLTQGGVTATVKRVMTRSALLWTGSAAGGFVITTPSGGNFAAGAATLSGGATVTLSGVETAITLAPGTTRFEFDRGNFSGQAATRRAYGCDGINKAFEFDGEVLAPITSGFSPDAPSHIAVHGDYLFLFMAASGVYSGPGTPFAYLAVNGGGEIACGDNVTGAISMPGAQNTATLGVFMAESTAILYGKSNADFNLQKFETGIGAIAGSLQNLFQTFAFDKQGVVTLQTSLNFGNFTQSPLTAKITTFIKQQRGRLTCSARLSEKGQYRAFFSDGFGLWLTSLGSTYLGAAIVQFPDPVLCCDTATMDGDEVSYFGSDNGYVYQLERGTSFDGEDLDASIVPAWDAQKNPRLLKQYRAASVEIVGEAYCSFMFGYSLAYGSTRMGQPSAETYTSNFSPAIWDDFTWDEFTWDGQTLIPSEVPMDGTAENVQPIITCGTDYIPAFQVNSIIYHWSPRRLMRGGG